jgi:hypothetical protein
MIDAAGRTRFLLARKRELIEIVRPDRRSNSTLAKTLRPLDPRSVP